MSVVDQQANAGGTRLWTGRTSGNSRGVLIAGYERRESAETDADLRQHHARVGELVRMAAVRRLHPCGDGKHRSVLEAGLRDFGGSV